MDETLSQLVLHRGETDLAKDYLTIACGPGADKDEVRSKREVHQLLV